MFCISKSLQNLISVTLLTKWQQILTFLCKRYSIDNTKRTKHTALIDCDLLAKVYINLLYQKEPKLDFKNSENSAEDKSDKNILYFKRVIKPSEDELKKHKEYLNNYLKKNYFN